TLLHLLRPEANRLQHLAVAERAAGGDRLVQPAVVTDEQTGAAMNRERNAAVAAAELVTTFPAQQLRRVSPAIDEDDGLLPRDAHHRNDRQLRSYYGEVTCVGSRRLMRLVRAVPFLTHHDHAQTGQWREERGARADGHVHVAAPRTPPLVVTLARGKIAVQD